MTKTQEIATSNTAPVLADLAEKINAEHVAAALALKKGLKHALEAGRALLEAKTIVGHGEWLPWLQDNVEVSERTAQAYMRLAREVPKLPPEKAQRVADLSYRETLRDLAQNTSRMAKLPADDQDRVIEQLEEDSIRFSGAIRAANQEKLTLPDALKPRTENVDGGRTVKVIVDKEHKCLCIIVGPNEAGANLTENVDTVRARPGYREWQDKIDDLKRKAEELRAEANQLEEDAQHEFGLMAQDIRKTLSDEFAPACHFIETYDYALSKAALDDMTGLALPEEVVEQMRQNPDGVFYLSSGWWGDMRVGKWSVNNTGTSTFDWPRGSDEPLPNSLREAAQAAGIRVGWHGVGSPGWLHKIFPDNALAPPALKPEFEDAAQ